MGEINPPTAADYAWESAKEAKRIAEQAARRTHVEWQPIETAPRGVPVLLAGDEPIFVGVVYDFVGVHGPGFGVRLDACDCQTGCGNTGAPTHWMPLPEGPCHD